MLVLMSSKHQKRHLLRGVPRAVLEEMDHEGWTLEYTGSGHIRWQHPSGAFAFSASTPSDHRAWKNQLAKLRRLARPLRIAAGTGAE